MNNKFKIIYKNNPIDDIFALEKENLLEIDHESELKILSKQIEAKTIFIFKS